MKCPVCNRTHTAALSICPSCGAMINDSVREELIGKISARLSSVKLDSKEIVEIKENPMPIQPTQPTARKPIIAEPVVANEISKSATANLPVRTTNPTLVEFHSKNSAIPEWRLQLQNAVRHRQGQTKSAAAPEIATQATVSPRAKLVTNGANAIKAEVVEAPSMLLNKNPDLARALDRIQKSRQKFLVAEEQIQSVASLIDAESKAGKNHKLYIAAKTDEANLIPAEVNLPISSFAKPKLAPALKVEPEKFDTNKLPPISPQIAEAFSEEEKKETLLEKIQSKIVKTEQSKEVVEVAETEEFEDCPTFAMRFNSGLFDLIIGSFVSLCLLAPFMLMGGDWLSGAGFFAFSATVSIVMFVYMTLAIGFYGRTFGMRLFSLELIDIEGEEYPSFHQAAVSSSVYLLSLAFGGLGFLTIFFNDEKRAAHDLVSNTVIVKE